ncbi:MAG: VWA domain-containing protein, partial [Firmicutes bacterium]|nr:VWA domain-containing protein [Bacillota bacterium]
MRNPWTPWKRPQASDSVLKNLDRYDRRAFSELLEKAEALKKLVEKGKGPLPTFDLLARDLWGSLFKASPEPAGPSEVAPHVRPHIQILEQVRAVPEYADLRRVTRLDELAAGLGTVSLGAKLVEAAKKLSEENRKALKRLAQARKKAEQAEKFRRDAEEMMQARAQNWEAGGGGEASENQAQPSASDPQKIEKEAQKLVSRAEKLEAQAEGIADDAARALAGTEVLSAVKEAVREAADEVKAWDAVSHLAGTGPGSPQYGPAPSLDEAVRLLRDRKLREIALAAGRMRNVAFSIRRKKVRQASGEVYSVTRGNDLARVLPQELALLSRPELKKEFLRRFAEGKLLQYETRGRGEEGRGPLVVCVDTSGSMAGPKEVWAKAVMLALFAVAARQRRAFAAVNFASKYETRTFEFEKPDRASPSEIREMAEFFWGGGTNFQQALESALSVMQKSAFKKGDIVFITDG